MPLGTSCYAKFMLSWSRMLLVGSLTRHLLQYPLMEISGSVHGISGCSVPLLVMCKWLFACAFEPERCRTLLPLSCLQMCVLPRKRFLSFRDAKWPFSGTHQAQKGTEMQTFPLAKDHKSLSGLRHLRQRTGTCFYLWLRQVFRFWLMQNLSFPALLFSCVILPIFVQLTQAFVIPKFYLLLILALTNYCLMFLRLRPSSRLIARTEWLRSWFCW